MFSFFRKSQDTKKTTSQDKETDDFVLLGQTAAEQRPDRPALPGTEFTYNEPFQVPQERIPNINGNDTGAGKMTTQASEGNAAMLELLSDIPFALAPHVQEMQNICSELPERVPMYNLEENFARYHYDFTLENSVLCGI
ncbi:UBAP1-MVB12-associated (UMA)-domain containing protein 1 [Spea bombifrons]|uniref:UBAP1-MVB12-associated (UMA)-domain containing protein 1 n=1 Tax=Spea bombifrons TaxID=233779 RepID=UPI00234A99BF|nr:UBAP1-MVB12-associated (UMA)-domain containing protein 1 [Spea bombifrons]XP_053323680.1 UBAP1-MVB12-associated (UMA)-domain containing protein 1 [Spea bombifrons]